MMDKKFQVNFYKQAREIKRDLDNQIQKMNFIKKMCDISYHSLILDVGCGAGFELLAFHEPSFELVGIDISCTLVKKCHEIARRTSRNPIHLLVADAENLPFRHGIFDLVFCIALLHHVPHPDVALTEMVRVAKHKGKLAVSEPNIFNFYNLLKTLAMYNLEGAALTTSAYIKKYINKLRVSEIRTSNLIITPKLISNNFSSLLRKIGNLLQNTPLNHLLSIVNIHTATVEKR